MAEDEEKNESSSNSNERSNVYGPENEPPSIATPDVCNDSAASSSNYRNISPSSSGYTEHYRREENPISFKHFLNQNAGSCGGARPKMYSSTRQNSLPTSDVQSNRLSAEGLRSEYSLPDFVQDHLVIEQCYLGADDFQNLPNFNIDRSLPKQWSENDANKTVGAEPMNRFSLAFDLTASQSNGASVEVDRVTTQASGEPKALPDFLSDGPIYSNRMSDLTADVGQVNSALDSNLSSTYNVDVEQRYRQQLDSLRRDVNDKNLLIQTLKKELICLRRASKNQVSATQLHEEYRHAISENEKLQMENQLLREQLALMESVSGTLATNPQAELQKLALNLRLAASEAEPTIRQLLSGLDNLRAIAATIETKNQNHDDDPVNNCMSDLDDKSGPAL